LDPVTASIAIGRPREEVFAYLVDIANHPEFEDHFLKDWHLTRENSVGRGAGARFRVEAPFQRFNWADVTLIEVEPSHRIVEVGRGGKFNRIRILITYRLTQAQGAGTRVEFTVETEPAKLSDRVLESLGLRRWFHRQQTKALRRLRSILEENAGRGQRATIAGV
jgi:uncharacterized protein YndB with AHSA1/START domain